MRDACVHTSSSSRSRCPARQGGHGWVVVSDDMSTGRTAWWWCRSSSSLSLCYRSCWQAEVRRCENEAELGVGRLGRGEPGRCVCAAAAAAAAATAPPWPLLRWMLGAVLLSCPALVGGCEMRPTRERQRIWPPMQSTLVACIFADRLHSPRPSSPLSGLTGLSNASTQAPAHPLTHTQTSISASARMPLLTEKMLHGDIS